LKQDLSTVNASSHTPTAEVHRLGPETVLVVLAGEHDLASAAVLERTFEQSLAECDHLIVDLSAAEFVDSSTLAALYGAKMRADESGRKFNLVLGTAPIVERALELSGILPALNVVKTVDQALAG
jgi:anti-anti-sigma factor